MTTGLTLNFTLSQIPFSPSSPLSNPNKTLQSYHKFPSFQLKIPSGSPLFTSKTPSKGQSSLLEVESLDLDDEFDEGLEEEGDEEIVVPLKHMRQWTKNKPLGFGEGKVYDTSIEDKLMEEIEQSRAAQIANVNTLKNSLEDKDPNSKKEKILKQKVSEVVPNGVRVRLVNLPKKKNIHRDLQAAFKGISGIVNVFPAVSGNEKTREPVCKGFAFIDFKSEKEANRFVNMFSAQPIIFGKVQKQIKCEIMKQSPPNPGPLKPFVNTMNNAPSRLNPSLGINSNPVLDTEDASFMEDAAFDKFKNGADDTVSVTQEYNDANVSFHSPVDDSEQEKDGSKTGAQSSNKVGENGKKKKKTRTAAKRKGEKTTKPTIPGSANRLKIKEKALLSGVFSKYGVNSAIAAKGQS